MTKQNRTQKDKPAGAWRMLNPLAAVVAALALAVTLVAAGFVVCAALPQTTWVFAQLFSGSANDETPFTHAELVDAAVAGRDYTVGSHDLDALLETLHAINDEAQTPYADVDDEALLSAPEEYTLDAEAVSHLDDVHAVVRAAYVALALIALLAVAALAHVGFRMHRRTLGRVLLASGAAVVALLAALGVWAAVDFYGFFNRFHTLFFSDGSWVFSGSSLLITMYPLAFWMGMAATWLVVTCLLSILSILVGRRLLRGGRHAA